MAWTRELTRMAPKNVRPLIFFMATVIVSSTGAIVFLAREDRTDCKTEIKEWKDKYETCRKETAECQIDMIIHLRQDRVQDSIDAVYNRQKIEVMQSKIDTLKNLLK